MELFETINAPNRKYDIYIDNDIYVTTIGNETLNSDSILKIKKFIYNDVISKLWINAPELDFNTDINQISVEQLQEIVDYIKVSTERTNFFKLYMVTSKYKNIFNYILDRGEAILFKDYDTFILQDFLSIYINIPTLCMNIGFGE